MKEPKILWMKIEISPTTEFKDALLVASDVAQKNKCEVAFEFNSEIWAVTYRGGAQ